MLVLNSRGSDVKKEFICVPNINATNAANNQTAERYEDGEGRSPLGRGERALRAVSDASECSSSAATLVGAPNKGGSGNCWGAAARADETCAGVIKNWPRPLARRDNAPLVDVAVDEVVMVMVGPVDMVDGELADGMIPLAANALFIALITDKPAEARRDATTLPRRGTITSLPAA
jgi:hypothetical protein